MRWAETEEITKGQEEAFEEGGYLDCLDGDVSQVKTYQIVDYKYVQFTCQLYHNKNV